MCLLTLPLTSHHSKEKLSMQTTWMDGTQKGGDQPLESEVKGGKGKQKAAASKIMVGCLQREGPYLAYNAESKLNGKSYIFMRQDNWEWAQREVLEKLHSPTKYPTLDDWEWLRLETKDPIAQRWSLIKMAWRFRQFTQHCSQMDYHQQAINWNIPGWAVRDQLTWGIGSGQMEGWMAPPTKHDTLQRWIMYTKKYSHFNALGIGRNSVTHLPNESTLRARYQLLNHLEPNETQYRSEWVRQYTYAITLLMVVAGGHCRLVEHKGLHIWNGCCAIPGIASTHAGRGSISPYTNYVACLRVETSNFVFAACWNGQYASADMTFTIPNSLFYTQYPSYTLQDQSELLQKKKKKIVTVRSWMQEVAERGNTVVFWAKATQEGLKVPFAM
ncbi:hypothetical protein CONPUDRAFT_77041 [Coniophora puteana RWD-64-598 SS2]|uniref:Uncharacterized protein n=1 Tax=Coniophora puteana (strain RWD-64-598) TaxID=741705 RepID=A0A5M3M9Q8_CONPW|nr:uncharacterized protein CONPUDRAFT_77041 [Coniophora puteana RWD-64-598 SS2]EIW76022.1 hypothetical protein CONPUDRAFT_77041 [Coniophora puteana RWD-64-598 SS2]